MAASARRRLVGVLAAELAALSAALEQQPQLQTLRAQLGAASSPSAFAAAWARTLAYLELVAQLWGWERPWTERVDPQVRPLLADLSGDARAALERIEQALAGRIEPSSADLDTALYAFEPLLERDDARVRARLGVYYTPAPLVHNVVGRVDRSVREQLGLPLGLAEGRSWKELGRDPPVGVDPAAPLVQILDPAAGSGAFLVAVVEQVAAGARARCEQAGLDGEAAARARQDELRRLLPRLHGVELMLTAWVAGLACLRHALERSGYRFGPEEQLDLRLADTLAPERPPLPRPTVILGNPPFARERAEQPRWGHIREGLLADYVEPARAAGAGAHVKNLYNLYVYFWRWASFELFERAPGPGILAFVSASSYLRGPGFVAMRAAMRAQAESIEILDLEGEPRGTRGSASVFDIATPVCVGTMIASGAPDPSRAARLRYVRLEGSREHKLRQCEAWAEGEGIPWREQSGGPRGAPLIVAGAADYPRWPALGQLFPWQHSGAQFKRTWPIACTPELLERRWRALLAAPPAERAALLRETRDRKAGRAYAGPLPGDPRRAALDSLPLDAAPPRIERYAFRPWDRHWCIADARVGDFLRPKLWAVASPRQIYMSSLLGGVIGPGPAAVVSAAVPDLHAFRGSYGGRDVIPLWRDAQARAPNLAPQLRERLAARWARPIEPEALFCYAYAVLANPGYVERFADALQVPGPRLPLSADWDGFARGVALGREQLRWHCYGERLGDTLRLRGRARLEGEVHGARGDYPQRYDYEPERGRLRLGGAELLELDPRLWEVSVSGLRVLESWLGYRMAGGAGRRSSALDELRPARWTEGMSRELLELAWVLEWSLAQRPALDAWLGELLEGPLLDASELLGAS